jgi:hypothetical protein
MIKLGDRQQTLQLNAVVVTKSAEITKGAQDAASDIRDATEHMAAAATHLYKNKPAEAVPSEERAIAKLATAIAKLEKQHDEVANKLKDEDLAAVIKSYEAIRTSQKEVKTGTETLAKNRAANNGLDRKQMLEAARLTTTQSDLLKKIAALSSNERLTEYDVIIWMNTQISNAMETSRSNLSKGQTGAPLVAVQQTAIDRLTDLIDALKEEKQRSEDSFANDPSPGSSGPPTGAPEKQPLLPPLAQLKLIRAMQSAVNEQTASVHTALKNATEDADRSRLRESAAKLGETQGQLKTIVERIAPK